MDTRGDAAKDVQRSRGQRGTSAMGIEKERQKLEAVIWSIVYMKLIRMRKNSAPVAAFVHIKTGKIRVRRTVAASLACLSSSSHPPAV
jgi:hypothetical protein